MSWSTTALRRQIVSLALEMRTPTDAGGLLPTGKASTTTRITYDQPRLRFCPTEETSSKRTSIQHASYYSSFLRNNQLAVPFCQMAIETETGQTPMFDPGGSTGHLRACLDGCQGTPRRAWWRVRSGTEVIRRFLDIVDLEPTHLSTYTKSVVLCVVLVPL